MTHSILIVLVLNYHVACQLIKQALLILYPHFRMFICFLVFLLFSVMVWFVIVAFSSNIHCCFSTLIEMLNLFSRLTEML